MFDVIVIGAGLMGAATARYLAASKVNVALIGPSEPSDQAAHHGVFSSHYDQSRIVRRTTRDMLWATLAERSLRGYARLEADSGVPLLFPRRGVHLVPAQKRSPFIDAAPRIARAFDVPYRELRDGAAIRALVPELTVPDATYGMVEEPPAGYLDPRALVRAQRSLTERDGGVWIDDVAVRLRSDAGMVVVTTGDGREHRAARVVVALGVYTGRSGLLPRRLAIEVKSETVLLARVSEQTARRLADLPTIVYEGGDERVSTPYLIPPLRYPDGHHYIKMGGNTRFDRYLTTSEEIGGWMREGTSDDAREEMASLLRSFVVDLELMSLHTKRCLIGYTPEGWPMVDRVAERIFVATGGNGLGAKCSDAIGALAAELTMNDRWTDGSLRAESFAARFEDHQIASEVPSAGANPVRQRPFGRPSK